MINLLFKKTFQITAIDFSSGWIKTAQARAGSGQPNAEFLADALEFSVEAENKVSRREFSKLLWSMLKAKPRVVYMCLARKYATVRFLRLPSADDVEIEKMLEFQAAKQLPFLKEDIAIGHKVLSVGQDGYSSVILVVVQKNIIDSQLSVMRTAGINPDFIYLSSEAVLNWFLSDTRRRQALQPESLYILIDIDANSGELMICLNGEILFMRSLECGASALKKVAAFNEWINILKEQIKISYTAFKKENAALEKKAQKIFISGGISEFSNRIKQALQEEFNIPVEFYSASNAGNAAKSVSVTNVLGAVCNTESLKINLMPRELKVKQLDKEKKDGLFRFYILLASLAACFFVMVTARFFYKQAYVSYLDGQLNQLKPYVQKAEFMSGKLKAAQQQSDKSNTALEILREIYSVIPRDINISNFSMNEGGVAIRGVSKTMSQVFETVSALESSKYFKNVKVVFTNKRKIAQQELVDFQVACVLEM